MLSRRRALGTGVALMGLAAGVVRAAGRPQAAARLEPERRRIALFNLESGEHLDVEYRVGGALVPASMDAIARLLRDRGSDAQHPIDATLLDDLYDGARMSGADPVFTVISGYRVQSPAGGSPGLHGQGRAIDLRLAGVGCANFAQRMRALGSGGVGYYRTADFVHVDTGGFRTWNG